MTKLQKKLTGAALIVAGSGGIAFFLANAITRPGTAGNVIWVFAVGMMALVAGVELTYHSTKR